MTEIVPSGIVLDDVIELGQGDKVVVDGVVVEADGLEIDESLLTGEADPVHKVVGEPVMSGSFAVAGNGAFRATKVGREASPPSSRRRPPGSRWSIPSCATASTRSSSS